jgi:hypothetical protein
MIGVKDWKFEFIELESILENPGIVERKHILKYFPDGWKNYGIAYGRTTEYSETIKSYTADWTFIKEDAKYLVDLLKNHGLNYEVKLRISELKNWITLEYEIQYEGAIDLTQLKWNANTATAPINEGGFLKLLEGKHGQEYDIELNENIIFNGVKIDNSNTYYKGNNSDYVEKIYNVVVPSTGDPSENPTLILNLAPKSIGRYSYFKEQKDAILGYIGNTVYGILNEDNLFYINKTPQKDIVYLDIDYSAYFETTFQTIGSVPYCIININLYEFNYDQIAGSDFSLSKRIKTTTIYRESFNNNNNSISAYVKCKTSVAIEPEGDCFLLGVYMSFGGNAQFNSSRKVRLLTYKCDINASRVFKRNENLILRTVKVQTVFQDLINKINNGEFSISLEISEFETHLRNKNRIEMLTSGVGLRGNSPRGIPFEGGEYIPTYLTTNLENFLHFIYICYGFLMQVEKEKRMYSNGTIFYLYKVSLKKKIDFYTNSKMLDLPQIKQAEFEFDRSSVYTSVAVGYEAKDESTGGLFEWNCKHTYSAPIKGIENNELNLVSPYSAAVFDIEMQISENYNNWENANDRDSEIFVLSCAEDPIGSGKIYLNRGTIIDENSNLPYPNTAWNALLSPRNVINIHKDELASLFFFERGEMLTLETCDRNKDFAYTYSGGHIDERTDVPIEGTPFFKPVNCRVSAPAITKILQKIGANKFGYIEFKQNGKTIKGYLAKSAQAAVVNPMQNKAHEFLLILTADSDM